MGITVVRYRVKAEEAQRNRELVEAVYAELAELDPPAFRYATFQLADGVTFVHLAVKDDDDDARPLTTLDAFKRFQQGLGDRCEEGPDVSRADLVGSFGLIDA